MKKGQLMAQPIIYIFYLVVAAMIVFFGIRVIGSLSNTGTKVQYATFANDIQQKIDTTYTDNMGSIVSLDEVSVPKDVVEVCFVSTKDLSKVTDTKLKQLINISDLSQSNAFFGGVDIKNGPARNFQHLTIDGTVCDITRDRKINLVLENIGTSVRVR